MNTFTTKNLRNVCLLGHGGSGKTSLAEAILYVTKTIDRAGTVSDGNTVCDYDAEEIKRGFSLGASFAPVEWRDIKINVMDTPGYFDFEGDVLECVRVADSAIIVVDGKAGVEVGTELAWNYAVEAGIPKSFFINRFDDGEARFYKVFGALREKFGNSLCPILIPCIDGDKVTGFLYLVDMKVYTFDSASGNYVTTDIPEQFMDVASEYHEKLMESVAGTSEELMEKFFEDHTSITQQEVVDAIHEGIIHGDIVPVFCGAATKMWGVRSLLNTIVDSYPRPTARVVEHDTEGGEIAIDKEGGETSLFVFKTVADPFVGKMSFFKVMNGELKKDMVLRNTTTGASEKISRIYIMRGKKQIEVDSLSCGDIGVLTKLTGTNTNDTLTARADDIRYRTVAYPKPYMTRAIQPAAKGDEDKISTGIARLLEETPTIAYENNAETKQLLLSGLGDLQLETVVAKLKTRYNTNVILTEPKIAYRETIKGTVKDVHGKHKKQSGGSGQYGHVIMNFAPGYEEGLTFSESVFGGAVPGNFFPAVEKGIQECMQKGVLAGYPMVGLAAELTGGSYHDVDSNELSFRLAASIAYKEGIPKAKPVILEPIGTLRVTIPDQYVGDVMGDLNKRRGRVMGIEPHESKEGLQVVISEVPQAEMTDYVIALRALTQGRGRFDFNFERYDEVPAQISQKIIADAAK